MPSSKNGMGPLYSISVNSLIFKLGILNSQRTRCYNLHLYTNVSIIQCGFPTMYVCIYSIQCIYCSIWIYTYLHMYLCTAKIDSPDYIYLALFMDTYENSLIRMCTYFCTI